ncbi:MAG: FkbM family methyltransferase [Verrucomicrobiota bacterium]
MQNFLKSIPVIGRPLASLHLEYVGWKFSPTRLIEKAIGHRDDVAVVVIGANDGPTTDPAFPLLQKHAGWSGTFVEPVPYLFEKLKNHYGASGRFSFVNAAVSRKTSEEKFYFVSPAARREVPELPSWVEQLGSFNRDHIAVQLNGRLEPFITEILVPTISLDELFSHTAQKRVDLLVIDTEGHDWEILRQLDLAIWKPDVIVFENCAISEEDQRAALKFLEPRYHVRNIGKDYFCTIRGTQN